MARIHRAAMAVVLVTSASTACMLSTDGLMGGVWIRDDFHRTTPLGPAWRAEACSGGTLVVDGSLVTSFPAEFGFAQCSLLSSETDPIGHFSVDFDIQATGDPTSGNVIPISILLDLPAPDERDIDEEQFQLSLNGAGRSEIGAIFRYHTSGSYIYYSLAASESFLSLKTACHVSMDIDGRIPSVLRATSTCDGKTVAMTQKPSATPPPTGFRANATVNLGFSQTDKDAGVPAWSLTYDNLVLQGLE